MRRERRMLVDRKRLQYATREQVAGFVGNIAIEEAVVAVLGHVDDACCCINGTGLVFETAHSPNRNGLDKFVGCG